MSVLVKGMKIPEGCITCVFESDGLYDRTMWCQWLDDPLGDYGKCDVKWRHPDCPLVEVPPHGRWVVSLLPGSEHVSCSECGAEYYEDDLLLGGNEFPRYCPNCGAEMEEQ